VKKAKFRSFLVCDEDVPFIFIGTWQHLHYYRSVCGSVMVSRAISVRVECTYEVEIREGRRLWVSHSPDHATLSSLLFYTPSLPSLQKTKTAAIKKQNPTHPTLHRFTINIILIPVLRHFLTFNSPRINCDLIRTLRIVSSSSDLSSCAPVLFIWIICLLLCVKVKKNPPRQ